MFDYPLSPKAKKCGDGWIDTCPAHHDNNPSLSITYRDGKLLLKCFAGCSFDEIIRCVAVNERYGRTIPLYETNRNRIVGYVRTIDLLLANQPNEIIAQASPMIEIRQDEVLGEALLTMQSKRETVARVTRDDGQTVGLLSIDQLTEPLLKGPLGSFQR